MAAEPNHVVRRYRPFVMVPVDVLDAIVEPNVLAVYVRLRQHADQNGEGAHPSRQRLAEMIGHSTPKAVDRAIAALVGLGLVDVFPRWRAADGSIAFERDGRHGQQTSNGYVIYDVPGAGSGAEMIEAPPEVREGGPLTAGAMQKTVTSQKSDGVPVRVGGESPAGDGGSPLQGTLTRSLELDPLNYPPAVGAEGYGARASGGAGEGDQSAAASGGADAHALARATPAAEAAVGAWAAERRGALTAGFRRRMVQHCAQALADGTPEEAVRRALRAWDDGTSRSPNRLPYLLDQCAQEIAQQRSASAEQRAAAQRTAAMLDEMKRGTVPPGSINTDEFMRRALSPEAWARRQARMQQERGAAPPLDTPEKPQE